MSFLKKITRSNFLIRLRSWEYWPFGVMQFPLFLYYLWLSLRSRSLLFFSASNPGIEMGGMFGESKIGILRKLPSELIPKTTFVELPTDVSRVEQILHSEKFSYPVIFKPDLGERGYKVKRISSAADIPGYLEDLKTDFLIQQLVDLPLEFGIFYTRFPSEKSGKITSVTAKEFLSVTGDGKSTLEELIRAEDRAKLQWEKLKITYKDRLSEVVGNGKKMELVSIGNHALGTKFLDGNYLINERLNATFDRISKKVDGFYFGRFDLRCSSLEDLYNGRVKIMELNGCGAEPAHIYDPAFPLWKGLVVMLTHWKNIYLISRENHKRGTPYLSFGEGIRFYRKFKEATGK
jgi:hypothetical protein